MDRFLLYFYLVKQWNITLRLRLEIKLHNVYPVASGRFGVWVLKAVKAVNTFQQLNETDVVKEKWILSPISSRLAPVTDKLRCQLKQCQLYIIAWIIL